MKEKYWLGKVNEITLSLSADNNQSSDENKIKQKE